MIYDDDDFEEYNKNDDFVFRYGENETEIVERYYNGEEISNEEYDKYPNLFLYKNELAKWNTKQLETHERWSYDVNTGIQKLERLIALCHRCHSSTHLGLSGLRGVNEHACKHLQKINKWTDKQLEEHHYKASELWKKRNQTHWKLDLSVLSNSGIDVILK